jgi:DNA-binding response OmpR family regulator
MCIVVASNNLFRRELSSYVLSEASYHVYEASSSGSLLEVLHTNKPLLIVLDSSLDQATTVLVEQVRTLSNAPILWLHNREAATVEEGALHWPYNPNELLRQVQGLISASIHERVVG